MKASASSLAPSKTSPAERERARTLGAARSHAARATSASDCPVHARTRSAASAWPARLWMWPLMSRWRCVRHRCQEQPGRTLETAATSPAWASDTASLTPRRPLSLREPRNSDQAASLSLSKQAQPRNSLCPEDDMPIAVTSATLA